jgi:hypothetical protein
MGDGSVRPSVRLDVRPSVSMSVRPSRCPSKRPSVSMYVSVRPSRCPSVRTVRMGMGMGMGMGMDMGMGMVMGDGSVRPSVRLDVRPSVTNDRCPPVCPLIGTSSFVREIDDPLKMTGSIVAFVWRFEGPAPAAPQRRNAARTRASGAHCACAPLRGAI